MPLKAVKVLSPLEVIAMSEVCCVSPRRSAEFLRNHPMMPISAGKLRMPVAFSNQRFSSTVLSTGIFFLFVQTFRVTFSCEPYA